MTVCLIVLFGLCQAAGALCPPEDITLQDAVTFTADDPMTCPMPGGLTCQPQLASSHGRDGEDGPAVHHHLDSQSQVVHVDTTISSSMSGDAWSAVPDIFPSLITETVSLTVLRI